MPLAERMRPKSLDEYIGQEHLVGAEGPVRRMVESGHLQSIIFWGPPGVGKTTLAELIAVALKRKFFALSAISSGVKDIREIIDSAGALFPPLLFIDEIHRFNKSQQDALLGAVERGKIVLIGATTENPSFEVNSALLSRCQVYALESHGKAELEKILERALTQDYFLKRKAIEVKETDALLLLSGGDARKMLNLLELAVLHQANQEPIIIDNALIKLVAKTKTGLYDKKGEMHYDVISAFIKSIRGSDPNAAVFYLAVMLDGGEDPQFIARRLLILASEDIGLADSNALVLAQAAFQAVSVIGMPEARIILSHCVIYLALAPKSNSAYVAINEALSFVKQTEQINIPLHLRNAPTRLMKEMGYGKDYKYVHDFEGNFTPQEYLPAKLSGTKFYHPGANENEQGLAQEMQKRWGKKYE
jgi:putative ATPase